MALRGSPPSAPSLEVLGARLADMALEQQQVTSRLEAGFASVRDRFRALDRGLATAHTQQELQSMAATALAVSSVDLSRTDRSKMLKELESKGKMVMTRLDGLQASKPGEDGASHGFVPPASELPPAALAAAGTGAVNGVVSALERRIAQLEVGGARAAQPPAAIPQRGVGTFASVQQVDPSWSRRLEEIEASMQAQMSALQTSLERRVESAESELRAMATAGTEQRRRDFDSFCMELRRELGAMSTGSCIFTPRADVQQSEAGSVVPAAEDPQARLQMLGSRIAMNKIELTARVAMIEDVVTRAQIATVAPRLRRAERLLEKVLHAQGMQGDAVDLSSSPGGSPPPSSVYVSRDVSRDVVQSV